MARKGISYEGSDAEKDEHIIEAAEGSRSKVKDSEMQFRWRGRKSAARTGGGKGGPTSASSAGISLVGDASM